MTMKLEAKDGGRTLEVFLRGKLVKEDYETFVPAVERLVAQHGKIRLLVAMLDFHGWTVGALWEDTKFAVHQFSAIERLAVVGEQKWQQRMAELCRPFTSAEVRYFDHSALEQARAWIERDHEPAAVDVPQRR